MSFYELRLSVFDADEGAASTQSLAEWLRADFGATSVLSEVSVMSAEAPAHIVQATVSSGGVSVVVRSLVAWLRTRPRNTRVVVAAPDGRRIELSNDNPVHNQVNELTAAFDLAPPGPDFDDD